MPKSEPPEMKAENPRGGKAARLQALHAQSDDGRQEYGIRQVQRPSAVKAVAGVLREEIFRRGEEDSFLGTEEDLLRQLGVSRPTFRQAVTLLEHEELLQSKRGAGGGFYTRRPTVEAVSHLASIHLFFADAKLVDIYRASAPIRREAARLLAANPSQEVRGALKAFVERHRGFEKLRDVQVNLRVAAGFDKLLAQLCGNPAFHLFLETCRDLGNVTRFPTEQPMGKERAQGWIDYMENLAEAIQQGDSQRAAEVTETHLNELINWQTAHRSTSS